MATRIFDENERIQLSHHSHTMRCKDITQEQLLGLLMALGEYSIRNVDLWCRGSEGEVPNDNHEALVFFRCSKEGKPIFDEDEQQSLVPQFYETITKTELADLLERLGEYAAGATPMDIPQGGDPIFPSGLQRKAIAHNALLRFSKEPFTLAEYEAASAVDLSGFIEP